MSCTANAPVGATNSSLDLRINDPEVGRSLTPNVPYPITLHEEEKLFEATTAVSDTYKFAIKAIEDKKFIKGCSINGADWKNSFATIGIFIRSKKHRGRGYSTDAMKVLMDFIFMQINININKIRLTVYSFNDAPIKCYERYGFKVEGILRQEL